MTENSKLDEVLARRKKARIARVAVGVALLLAILAWFWLWPRGDEPVDTPPTAQPATQELPPQQPPAPEAAGGSVPDTAGAAVATQAPVLPALDQSDAYVREAVATLSRSQEVARWLLSDDLVRRAVAAVDNIAEGRSPRRHLAFLGPKGRFAVEGDEQEDPLVMADPRAYGRYDTLARAIDALDAQGSARLYRYLLPILEEAYVDLGYPDGGFEARLQEAAGQLLEVPVLEGDLPLVPQVRRFEFVDPYLESLSDAQKHLLRMGPDNTRRIQRKLRQVMAIIDPSWQAPAQRVYRSKTELPED